MTFNAGIPNSGQSPAFLPTQNQTNMNRIRANVEADHVFNDTASTTDGIHKRVTYVNIAPPNTLLTNTNSILYSTIDSNNASQLHFYNGATDVQLTPLSVGPIRVQGTTTVTINAGATFPIPGLPPEFLGTGFVFFNGLAVYTYSNLVLINGNNDKNVIDSHGGSAPFLNAPDFTFISNVLNVRNNAAIPAIIVWSLIINVYP